MCFDVDTLDQIRTAAKGAVEKFPVTPFHLEMAASSTRAGNWAWIHKAFWPKEVKLPDFAQHIFTVQQQSACWQSSYVGYQEYLSQSLS